MRVESAGSRWRVKRLGDMGPFESLDPDSRRDFWTDGGVHRNLTFPAQPDPVSGMHCWHQAVRVERALQGDAYGDAEVDTEKAFAFYREWLATAPPREGPGGLRCPEWLARAVRASARADGRERG